MYPISGKWILLLLVAPVVLLVLIVAIGAVVGNYVRRRCPACMQRALKQMSVVRAQTIVAGEEQPDYRAYFRCEKCASRFKLHEGILSGVPEDEMSDATRFG
ncbi:hypothetical protein BH09PLA1_BH09PLA1_21460 [soil metagenome]